MAHEVGHFFGLFHIFTGGCNDVNDCENGDFIATTPKCNVVTIEEPTDCDDFPNSCVPGTNYPRENFMSYVACRDRFVDEQFDRMGMFLPEYSNLYSTQNLNRTVYSGPTTNFESDVTISTNLSNQTLSTGENITITISGDVSLSNVNLKMGNGSTIIIPSQSSLSISNNNITGNECSQKMWDGIQLNGGEFTSGSNSSIQNSYIGLDVKYQSDINIFNTNFLNNYIGIQFGEDTNFTPPPLTLPPTVNILNFFGNTIK